jgi:hypothetical protein
MTMPGNTTTHPSAEVLHAFKAGQLTPDAAQTIFRHLLACPDCTRAAQDIPLHPTPGDGRRVRHVVYLHHARDTDGEVIFFFTDPDAGGAEYCSSPVTGLRRLRSAVIDQQKHGVLARFRITTHNTDYETQMPQDKAAHLATELGLAK